MSCFCYFQALNLPKSYRNGKLHAYKLLCQMTMNNRNIPLGQKYVVQFFKVLHHGLTSSDEVYFIFILLFFLVIKIIIIIITNYCLCYRKLLIPY